MQYHKVFECQSISTWIIDTMQQHDRQRTQTKQEQIQQYLSLEGLHYVKHNFPENSFFNSETHFWFKITNVFYYEYGMSSFLVFTLHFLQRRATCVTIFLLQAKASHKSINFVFISNKQSWKTRCVLLKRSGIRVFVVIFLLVNSISMFIRRFSGGQHYLLEKGHSYRHTVNFFLPR